MLQIFSISKPIKHLSSLVIVENFKVLIIINERLKKRLNTKELMLSNCGAGEASWDSLGLQDQTNCKEVSQS